MKVARSCYSARSIYAITEKVHFFFLPLISISQSSDLSFYGFVLSQRKHQAWFAYLLYNNMAAVVAPKKLGQQRPRHFSWLIS
ncbi:unnamed protein product [Amoebophrya sp. A120]|nr:unnamed protein product [Amoebophrya sp. A120]|eukprot:GSA120T00014568001.1